VNQAIGSVAQTIGNIMGNPIPQDPAQNQPNYRSQIENSVSLNTHSEQ